LRIFYFLPVDLPLLHSGGLGGQDRPDCGEEDGLAKVALSDSRPASSLRDVTMQWLSVTKAAAISPGEFLC
jgi:hypothetical protein